MFADRVVPVLRCSALFGGLCLLAACVADAEEPQTTGTVSTLQRLASYACDDDSTLTVESLGSAVRIVEAEGSSIDPPAAPPTQNARFGGDNRALVIEDGEALYMVAGQPVRTCHSS